MIFLLYGKYKGLRDASWNTLIDYGISELPVRPSVIVRASGIALLKDKNAQILAPGALGYSICQLNRWYIVYKDTLCTELARVVIAHELGHIFLGHELSQPAYCRMFNPRNEQEQEAEMFAIRLLAPACVLWALDLHTAEEIANVCGIPIEQAERRAERMEVLYARNVFLKSQLERKLYDNFKQFIQNKRT